MWIRISLVYPEIVFYVPILFVYFKIILFYKESYTKIIRYVTNETSEIESNLYCFIRSYTVLVYCFSLYISACIACNWRFKIIFQENETSFWLCLFSELLVYTK